MNVWYKNWEEMNENKMNNKNIKKTKQNKKEKEKGEKLLVIKEAWIKQKNEFIETLC